MREQKLREQKLRGQKLREQKSRDKGAEILVNKIPKLYCLRKILTHHTVSKYLKN